LKDFLKYDQIPVFLKIVQVSNEYMNLPDLDDDCQIKALKKSDYVAIKKGKSLSSDSPSDIAEI
jgi:hypothetical protein